MLTTLLETIRYWVQTVLAKFHSTYLGYATPQMYGAVGDGVHDDTQALIQCFATNNTIHIPKGTYLCSKQLVLHSNIHVVGEGMDSVTIMFTAEGNKQGKSPNQIETQGRVVTGISDYGYRSEKVSNIHIEGVTLDSNYTVCIPNHPNSEHHEASIEDTSGKWMICLTNCEDVVIKNVRSKVSQLYDEASCFKVLVNTHNVLFEGCEFLKMQQFTIGTNEVRDTGYLSGIGGTDNITFKNCYFYQKGGKDEILGIYGAYNKTSQLTTTVKNVLVDGCKFVGELSEETGASRPPFFISVPYGCSSNINITNCDIEDSLSATATIKRHVAEVVHTKDELVLDNCRMILNSGSSGLYTEGTHDKPITIFQNGRIEHFSGKICSNKNSKVFCSFIDLNSSTSATNSGIFEKCIIHANDCDYFMTGQNGELIGCTFYSNTITRMIINAVKVVNCIFKGQTRIGIQFNTSNSICEVKNNLFEYDGSVSDNDSCNSNNYIIVGNTCENEFTISRMVGTNLKKFIVDHNAVRYRVNANREDMYTQRGHNSFDNDVPYVLTLPTASRSNLNKKYLLAGTQTGYKKGLTYECVETSTDVFEWRPLNDLVTRSEMEQYIQDIIAQQQQQQS